MAPDRLTIGDVKILEEFLQKVGRERLTGVISVVLLFVLGFVCLFGQVSIPAYNFSLPQTKLGLALLTVGIVWVTLAFLMFSRARRARAESDAAPNGDLFSLAARPPEPPKVRVQVMGEGEGMSFWKNDGAGELRAWLDVVNFTSAPVKIDRILGEITVANATVAQFSHFKKQIVAPVSSGNVFVQAELSADHIRKIEFQLTREHAPSAGLNLTVYVATDNGELELHPRLATGNCRYVNFARKPNT